MCKAHGVHLIGSVALPDTKAVFAAVSGALGPWLKRLPDGETGERGRWVYWQREKLLKHPDFELDPHAPPLLIHEWNGKLIRTTQLLRFRPGVNPDNVIFEPGYARAALESYSVFKRMQDAGEIGGDIRFQVCLPTAMAPGFMYISQASQQDFLRVYEAALLRELQEICAAIPHQSLAIQWDVCQEVLIYENYFPHRPDDYKLVIGQELARLGDAVPEGVECGFHLCYGSPADEHLTLPKDTGVMVEIVESFLPRLHRHMDFLHLPVPKDRTDDAYFAPLHALKLPPETELYLGVIHYDDAQGDRARIAAAKTAVGAFGISTECGWGRADTAKVMPLIKAHRAVMQAD